MPIRRHAHMRTEAPPLSEASLDDPVGAMMELQDEQRRIADELEDTFLAYDRRLQEAAKRIASLGPESVTVEERERLRAEQLELWRLVRRAQAAQRSTRELAREVREWKEYGPTQAPEGHPDHPETRVEIVESELRVRGVLDTVRETTPHQSSEPFVAASDEVGIHWLHRPMVHEEEEEAAAAIHASSAVSAPEWAHDTDEHLLREIVHAERELLRTDTPAEIVDLLKQLRSLHGHLRLHDRRHGRPRVRYTLGFGVHV